MTNVEKRLSENLHSVEQRISEAARRSGRGRDDITLVAITKYVDSNIAASLHAAGCQHLGESRPQELWEKADQLTGLPIVWHLVGHLQRNKVRRTLDYTSRIHSVDSLRLIKAIEKNAKELNHDVSILLEVNVSGESAKHGFDAESIDTTFDFLSTAEHIKVRGLMCMAGWGVDQQLVRQQFTILRQLRDRLINQVPENVTLDDLSMGMSGDFEIAIEEGATIVRIGSVLFEGII